MIAYNPYTPDWHKEAPADITLEQYAKAWIDMEPHIGQLRDYASRAKTIVEFGIRGGVSTWAMLEGLPDHGELHGVDIENVFDRLPEAVRRDRRFYFTVADSLTADVPPADLVMIDSSHEFAQTVCELVRAASWLPERILLHDYLYAECHGTVKQAVDGFVGTYYLQEPAYRLETVHPSSWGLAVLVRR